MTIVRPENVVVGKNLDIVDSEIGTGGGQEAVADPETCATSPTNYKLIMSDSIILV